jgi:hypothetical protein
LGDRCNRIRACDAYEALVQHGNYALTCSNFLFDRSVWQQCSGFDEGLRTNCDFDFLRRITRKHDLGYVDQELLYWRTHDASLYRTAPYLLRRQELAVVFDRFEPVLLSAATRVVRKQVVRQELLGLAYLTRQNGDCLPALAHYLASITKGGWSREAVLGIAKLIPFRLLGRRA